MPGNRKTSIPRLRPIAVDPSPAKDVDPAGGLLAARGLKGALDEDTATDAPFDERLDIAWNKWGSV